MPGTGGSPEPLLFTGLSRHSFTGMDHSETAPLDALLRDAGSALSEEDLSALILGALAAPGTDGGMGTVDAWIAMVADNPPSELRLQLQALYATAQSSGEPAIGKSFSSDRLTALREELARQSLAGFVIPLADEHQGEYVAKRARRLAWLTGFTGSAGVAIVLAEQAALFVDGRYTLQAGDQVDTTLFDIRHLSDSPPADWIRTQLPKEGRLGYDPWLHTAMGVLNLRKACTQVGGELVAVQANPIDRIWQDQPPPPLSPVVGHDLGYAGKPSHDKRSEIAADLAEAGEDAVVLTAPDSIAWLANIRGGDVPYTPLALGFGVLNKDSTLDLFMDPRKVLPTTRTGLDKGIRIFPPEEFAPALDKLGADGKTVRADPATAAEAIFSRLEAGGAKINRGEDPCALPKARKNDTELEGMRAAHRRDGAALTRFLAWLDANAAKGGITEISAADRLEAFRREDDLIQGLSFPTISGAGANGAIVHYRVTPETDRALEPGSLYLVDSGAQYLDGTTDVTRTVAIGTPSEEMRQRFTQVLKGHIALGSARFPKGTSGSQLDVLARLPLWQAGIDFDHGTGHGVGSYLGVHEGPQRISKIPNRIALEPGMVISNEPGYYKTDAYGIRIENLVAVREAGVPAGAEKDLLEFETLTVAPIDLNLVDRDMLTDTETAWLNDYHRWVRETIISLVDSATASWLERATQPI